ncbi:DNA repair protein RAD51 homolog 3-like [Convolutriloba macropyga]|uniref:DNA repair protein RAD51 homolog 3-like n=1 Tax=Convolutriloba macropyga TaxID=536237 RepID=UPI003F5233B6
MDGATEEPHPDKMFEISKRVDFQLELLHLNPETRTALSHLKVRSSQEFSSKIDDMRKVLSEDQIREVESKCKQFKRCVHGVKKQSGYQLLKQTEERKKFCVRSFSKSIDNQLGCGFRQGLIYELVGAPGCGKTQMCMQLMASAFVPKSLLGPEAESVIFIDTECSFFPDRFREILEETVEHCCNLNPALNDDQDFVSNQIFQKIKAFRCLSLEELTACLDQLISNYHQDPSLTKPKIVVIDSIAAPFRTIDFDTNQKRQTAIANFSSQLLQLRKLTEACIVLTNHVTTKLIDQSENGKTEGLFVPYLGDFWGTVPNVRALLSEDEDGRKFTVFKQILSLAAVDRNRSAPFEISRSGIRDLR